MNKEKIMTKYTKQNKYTNNDILKLIANEDVLDYLINCKFNYHCQNKYRRDCQ